MPGNIRWHLVPSKNFLPARKLKLSAAHGDLVRSILTLTAPKLVLTVITLVPVLGGVVVGGTPTSFVVGLRSPAGTWVQAQDTGPPDASAPGDVLSSSPTAETSHTVPTATSS